MGASAVSASRLLRADAREEAAVSHQPAYLSLQPFIEAGRDEFPSEHAALALRSFLHDALRNRELATTDSLRGTSPAARSHRAIAPDLHIAEFETNENVGDGWRKWVSALGTIRHAEFYPLPDDIVRFEVAGESQGKLFHRTGFWEIKTQDGKVSAFEAKEEHLASADHPYFIDITAHALANAPEARNQLAPGVPYWRSHLDPACGIDIYGSNGIAVGDIDGDGIDEVYVCQPGGLPNRLLKFDSDGTLRDLTESWGVGLLDETSAALFLDLRNTGRQDLVVLRSGGPVLFVNHGNSYKLRSDAFRFARQPLGGFTGMAAADFDRDGRLDLYLCCYVYFQSEAQFTYPAPYHDAQNGPPNFLFRNRLDKDGNGSFEDCTVETGIDGNNNRFSFAPAWCDFNDDGWPDLYVANDFGRKNLYVNREGKFHDVAHDAGVEDIGPGMSASWFDYDGDGRPDLYVANMWSDAGQRVVHDANFAPVRRPGARDAYDRHTRGNSLYRNRGDGTFEDVTFAQQVQFGRWAWSSCGADFDNDGQPEILGTCGMLTNKSNIDLMGFFWRQVVAKSPPAAEESVPYQNGWNAINQFIREDYSWNGHEPNVFHAKRGDRFFDFSGVSGLDFADDSRAFAMTDFDGDGRPDILLKSRLGPQLRVLRNNCSQANHSIAIQLEGSKSNRDAIGAKVRLGTQTKWLEAGSGFLSQHSKRLLFGLGASTEVDGGEIVWPSGERQSLPVLKSGATYFVKEGVTEMRHVPFRDRLPISSNTLPGNNNVGLEETWLLEPLPFPEEQSGPGLLTLDPDRLRATPDRLRQYEIFRRYLFDYRAPLESPISFLLNEKGQAIKVYPGTPTESVVRQDRARMAEHRKWALPFPGTYVVPPRRDFAKFGIAYLMSGYPKQALPYLEQVLQRSPDNARVLALVGRINLDEHRYPEAERYFERSLSAGPPTPESLYGLALSLAKQNRLEEATTYFKRAIEARPDFADAINDLGALYTQQGKWNDAIAAFQYGIRVAPDEDILYLNLGRTYARTAQLDRARQVMLKLLERKPDSLTARHALQELDGRN